jgi:hypothetical protein
MPVHGDGAGAPGGEDGALNGWLIPSTAAGIGGTNGRGVHGSTELPKATSSDIGTRNLIEAAIQRL